MASSRVGKMLQDLEGLKYFNKNRLYVCVDNKKTKYSCRRQGVKNA